MGQATPTPESTPGTSAGRSGHLDRGEQAAALCGAAFVLLAVLYIFLSPAVDPTASPQTVARAYTDHRAAALVWNEVGALAFFFYLFFLGALYNRLRRAEGGTGWLALIAFAGGLGLVITHAVETLSALVLAWHVAPDAVSGGDFSSVRVLFDLNNLTVYYDVIPTAASIAAVSIVTFRTDVFPRWFGWVGILLAVAGLVTTLSIANPKGAFSAVAENVYSIPFLFLYVPALVYFLARPERSVRAT